MHTLKFPAAICACALAFTMAARADDNADQAAARAAVLAALSQTDAGAPATNAPVAPAVSAPPAAITAPVIVAAPTQTPDETVVPVGDTPAQAAARAALLQKFQQIDASTPATPTMTYQWHFTPTNTTPTLQTSPAVVVAPTMTSTNSPAMAVRTTPVTYQALMTPPPASTTVTNLVFHPIIAPSLPISDTKATRLQALDAQYKAGQITPQDYFTQRETILNGN